MALNTVIKNRMRSLNIGNKELAEHSDVPLRTVNNILSGITDDPRLETIRAIAHALDYTLDDIAEEVSRASRSIPCGAEAELLDLFCKLNEEGQKLLLQRANELVQLGYIKSDSYRMVEDA